MKQFKFHYVSTLIALAAALGLGNSCEKKTEKDKIPSSENGEKMVSSVVLHPGVDLWLGVERLDSEVVSMIERFPLYAVHHKRYAISRANLKRLRASREDVVATLRARIERAAKKALASPASGKSVSALEFELTMAVDLNAVELLDLITGTARQLHTWLVDFERGKLETYLATTHADLHRNLLSALSGLLKQESFEPIVNEEWGSEFTFEKAQSESEFGGNLLDPNVQLTDESEPSFPVAGMAPFTSEISQKLIDWGQEFLATTPEADRKGPSGMERPAPAWK